MKIEEAVKLLLENKKKKFTEAVDIGVILNLKEKQLKEVVRGSIKFPNKFGEDKRIIVFVEDENLQKSSIAAGAVKAGFEDLLNSVFSEEFNDFDIVIATPSIMPKIAKLGKVLGPRGLMPNPKTGTIDSDPVKAIELFKSGIVNFKSLQDHGTINLAIGKTDMTEEKIIENFLAAVESITSEAKKLNTPAIKRVIIKATMGSPFQIDL